MYSQDGDVVIDNIVSKTVPKGQVTDITSA